MNKTQAKQNNPLVTFVIPTLNAESFIESCLQAIRQQNYPQDKIEIIVADAYSKDATVAIAKKYGAIVIENPEILHEPGKTLATKEANGEIIFYTDADNIIVGQSWIRDMVSAYQNEENVIGLLPQTIPPPDSSALNRYLGYLFTDPLTWFIYGSAANPVDYSKIYQPIKQTANYTLYRFQQKNHPLFGLSQGSGATKLFRRGGEGASDDILSGIQMIEQGGLIAVVPNAGVYHYHVTSLSNFLRKYRWRVRNNLTQEITQMGLVNRLKYFNFGRKLKLLLFIPYALSLIFPFISSLRLAIRWRDPVMFWHTLTCFCLAIIILTEYATKTIGLQNRLGTYGK